MAAISAHTPYGLTHVGMSWHHRLWASDMITPARRAGWMGTKTHGWITGRSWNQATWYDWHSR